MILHEIKCMFCDMPESDANVFITDAKGSICSECVETCSVLLKNNQIVLLLKQIANELKKPHEIKAHLDQYVIGQDQAKKTLSVAVYNHYKRIEIQKVYKDSIIQKSNIMILGGTGTGKTFMLEKIADFLQVPITIVDATQYTETGYVGLDVNIMLRELYLAADSDLARTEKGIIYIDEIDKLADKGGRPAGDLGVQQGLLKLVENNIMDVPLEGAHVGGRAADKSGSIKICTKDILFICGGAFSSLKKHVKNKITKHNLGFATENKEELKDDKSIYSKITTNDLIDYGMLNEFLGRFPVRVYLEELTVESLKKILVEPKDSLIKQFQLLLEFDKVKLIFEDKALDKIAEEVLKLNIGARGNRTVLEKVLNEIMFNAGLDNEEKEVTITEDMIHD